MPLDQLVVQVRSGPEPARQGRRTEGLPGRLPVVRGDAGMLRLALTEVLARTLDVTRGEELPIVQLGCEEDEREPRVGCGTTGRA
ncbi:hypothetical protein [Deinococcus pimensis]|uniref:hypothetical protein n=1 Tax=Deinococcus pimensis TaxID=309888 RepID=UPI000486863A|nr:hypothetical protein [Deinococcus pimensis]